VTVFVLHKDEQQNVGQELSFEQAHNLFFLQFLVFFRLEEKFTLTVLHEKYTIDRLPAAGGTGLGTK